MAKLGLPVPPGFTITTEVCTEFYANKRNYPAELSDQVDAAMATLEKKSGKGFGNASNPLLGSVRSGSRASMPGMMDTVLNLVSTMRLLKVWRNFLAMRALRTTATGASFRCIRTWCSNWSMASSKTSSARRKNCRAIHPTLR
jgi:phosphoenolpyruvate synthase/pyruvate phosphate dikinase